MKTKTATDKFNSMKSMRITFFLHAAILIMAMVPMISNTVPDKEDDIFIIPIEFAELSNQGNEGMQARSIKPAPTPQPVVEKEEPIPSPVEAPEVVEEIQIIEEIEPVEAEIVEEAEAEVVASEDNVVSEAEVSSAVGGSDATNIEGDQEGTESEGEEDGLAGLDGDGVLTRKIIHREDISQVAEQSGVIAVNICIDRKGSVTHTKYNEEHTTITDFDLIKRALYIAVAYRFEVNHTAPKRECGMMTFIFDVQK